MTKNTFIDAAFTLASILLVLAIIVVAIRSFSARATKFDQCTQVCEPYRSIIVDQECLCRTHDGWMEKDSSNE